MGLRCLDDGLIQDTKTDWLRISVEESGCLTNSPVPPWCLSRFPGFSNVRECTAVT